MLTEAQAAEFTIENVIGGDDDWEPNVYTEQLLAPFIQIENNVISWTENKYALCWGIFRNGKIVEFVTENSYAVPVGNEGAVYTVRAANEYGGLSETSNKVTAVETVVDAEIDSAVNNTVNEKTVVDEKYISVDGKVYSNPVKGVNIVKRTMNDGSVEMINVFVK